MPGVSFGSGPAFRLRNDYAGEAAKMRFGKRLREPNTQSSSAGAVRRSRKSTLQSRDRMGYEGIW